MTKVSIVIQSHLSDASIDIAHNPYMASRRIKFVKLLIEFLLPRGARPIIGT